MSALYSNYVLAKNPLREQIACQVNEFLSRPKAAKADVAARVQGVASAVKAKKASAKAVKKTLSSIPEWPGRATVLALMAEYGIKAFDLKSKTGIPGSYVDDVMRCRYNPSRNRAALIERAASDLAMQKEAARGRE